MLVGKNSVVFCASPLKRIEDPSRREYPLKLNIFGVTEMREDPKLHLEFYKFTTSSYHFQLLSIDFKETRCTGSEPEILSYPIVY